MKLTVQYDCYPMAKFRNFISLLLTERFSIDSDFHLTDTHIA